MPAQQLPGHYLVKPTIPDQCHSIERPFTRPSCQEKLLLAAGTLYCPQLALEGQKTVLAQHYAQPAGIVSRMYSNHFPGCVVHGNEVDDLLRVELHKRVIDTTPDFINHIFPPERKPFIVNEDFYEKLSQTNVGGNSFLWDKRKRTLAEPASYSEQHLAEWLNLLSKIMGETYGACSTRIWSHRSKNTPLVGTNIYRKPDLILIDKSYEERLRSNYDHNTDWCFIKAFAEVTAEKRTPMRMTRTINAKSYLMFQCQVNRRFVVALSFTANGKFTLTLTDREGQLRWLETPLFENKKHLDHFFHIFSFLMFGKESNVGLDPNFEFDNFGKLLAITVDEKRFVVEKLIYELACIVGRATRVWIVKGDNRQYVLKDSWIQEHHVDSEIRILQMIAKSSGHDKIKESVPQFVCGGDVMVDGTLDCTGYYRKDLHGWPESQRIHRRMVSFPIGEPITAFRSKKEFIGAIISILKAHRSLYNDIGVLHRDISLNNVLLRRVEGVDEAIGLLIDYDYAELLLLLDSPQADNTDVAPDPGKSSQPFVKPIRTGTPPFMAIEALITENENFTQHPRHDLESILYVIFYICTFTKGPSKSRLIKEVPDTLPLRKWFSDQDPKEIGLRKVANMTEPEQMITNHFTNYWADFAPFALQLASTCFPSKPSIANELTHKRMLEILHTAYDQVVEISDEGLDGRKRQRLGDDNQMPTKRGRRVVERVE